MFHPAGDALLAELAQRVVFAHMGAREEMLLYCFQLARHNNAPVMLLWQEPGGIVTTYEIPAPTAGGSPVRRTQARL